ncbi:polyprenyl synthetase family protein [Syntrophorhabdus aromaticivorans]|uniref:polyprenyl synthetase family protein n=1 Tax=Syntrophorhabdus aromaticivorans TaxID=328301 RepID=UPI0003FBAFB8|nr:polyprenyl synthetase family protein [Syntrophorhabdus aromaticivorans]
METITKLIADDLAELESTIQKLITTRITFIKEIVNHIIRSGGKRVRPILVILAARLCGYKDQEHIPYAAIIEFIHTATLLHDDVVDNAKIRRGSSTANTVWGNEPSVLVGDFLFSKSFELMAFSENEEILKVMSRASTCLAEGEILELLKTCDPETDEAEYLEIIGNKTASLFSAACEVGGILGEVSQKKRLALRDFGYNLGMAFQLTDDILDYVSDDAVLGKRVGTDLKEGKVTLPLIHALKHGTDKEKGYVAAVLNKAKMTPRDFERVRKIIRKHGGVEYTSKVTKQFVDNAKDFLKVFKPSVYKESLMTLADYMLARET